MGISTLITFTALFWVMCAMLGALVVVAVIAVAKAYREERALPLEP